MWAAAQWEEGAQAVLGTARGRSGGSSGRVAAGAARVTLAEVRELLEGAKGLVVIPTEERAALEELRIRLEDWVARVRTALSSVGRGRGRAARSADASAGLKASAWAALCAEADALRLEATELESARDAWRRSEWGAASHPARTLFMCVRACVLMLSSACERASVRACEWEWLMVGT